jgi:hypothetical protein
MSDLRARHGVKIVDPSTDANEVGVDASGNLQAILAANTGVDIGDVDVLTLPNTETDDDIVAGAQNAMRVIGLGYGWDGTQWERLQTDASGALDVNFASGVDTELPAAAALTDNFTNPTAPAVGAFGMVWDSATWDRMPGTSVDGVLVNLGTNNNVGLDAGANNIGDVDVLTLPATAAEAAALPAVFTVVAGDDGVDTHPLQLDASGFLKAILQSNTGVDIGDVDVLSLPSDTFVATDGAYGKGVLIQGDDGTDRHNVLVDTSGHLQVDVLTGGGSDSPATPVVATANSTNTAAGSSADLDTADQAANRDLWGVIVSASVPFKVQIKKVEDATPSNLSALIFGRPNEAVYIEPPHQDFWTLTGGAAGLDAFRASVTNMDNSQAADLHATFFYADA